MTTVRTSKWQYNLLMGTNAGVFITILANIHKPVANDLPVMAVPRNSRYREQLAVRGKYCRLAGIPCCLSWWLSARCEVCPVSEECFCHLFMRLCRIESAVVQKEMEWWVDCLYRSPTLDSPSCVFMNHVHFIYEKIGQSNTSSHVLAVGARW